MKNKKKIPKEHGIISIVQSPDKGDKLVIENEPDKQKEHGIISVVQSPEEEIEKNKVNLRNSSG